MLMAVRSETQEQVRAPSPISLYNCRKDEGKKGQRQRGHHKNPERRRHPKFSPAFDEIGAEDCLKDSISGRAIT